jgi:hypothetical protein
MFFLALSLAASGGYVTIIKLLLNYGAEINSRLVFIYLFIYFSKSLLIFRTGSKLGITVSNDSIFNEKQKFRIMSFLAINACFNEWTCWCSETFIRYGC